MIFEQQQPKMTYAFKKNLSGRKGTEDALEQVDD